VRKPCDIIQGELAFGKVAETGHPSAVEAESVTASVDTPTP